MAIGTAAVLAIAVGAYLWSRFDRRPVASRAEWVQLTNLDSVTQPALSPDGRMLAFIRGPSTFVSPGQLYVKLLPDGEPVALTNDTLPKMGPVFSPTAAASPTPSTTGTRGTRGRCRLSGAERVAGCATPLA